MEITFTPLNTTHFPMLLKWVMSEHVQKWWDQNTSWTPELIKAKYTSYTEGFKLEQGKQKAIYAYVFCASEVPIGYIQYYDIRDFPRDTQLPDNLPARAAALDFYIGDPSYLQKGYGRASLKTFCEEIILQNFDACFVDPDFANEAAIRGYESAGFRLVQKAEGAVWMALSL